MSKPVFRVTKDDFEVTWFQKKSGGQHSNKHANCCRLKHKDTGIIKVGTDHKERPRNQKDALTSMANDARFKAYCERRLRELEDKQTLEQWVDEQMKPENLQIQIKEEGKWVDEKH